jgi:hypothetical protein
MAVIERGDEDSEEAVGGQEVARKDGEGVLVARIWVAGLETQRPRDLAGRRSLQSGLEWLARRALGKGGPFTEPYALLVTADACESVSERRDA